MTRSFGDQLAHEIGVISSPEISQKTIDQDSQFILLASDGLLEVVEKRHITEATRDCTSNNKPHEIIGSLMKLAIDA